MEQRAHKLLVDAADWDVKIGVGTGIAVTLLRLLPLIGFFNAPQRDWIVFAEIAVQLFLTVVFTVGLYRHQTWAAIGLLVVWGFGFFYSWALSGRILPPLALIGILIWYGLYRGFRGTRRLAAAEHGEP